MYYENRNEHTTQWQPPTHMQIAAGAGQQISLASSVSCPQNHQHPSNAELVALAGMPGDTPIHAVPIHLPGPSLISSSQHSTVLQQQQHRHSVMPQSHQHRHIHYSHPQPQFPQSASLEGCDDALQSLLSGNNEDDEWWQAGAGSATQWNSDDQPDHPEGEHVMHPIHPDSELNRGSYSQVLLSMAGQEPPHDDRAEELSVQSLKQFTASNTTECHAKVAAHYDRFHPTHPGLKVSNPRGGVLCLECNAGCGVKIVYCRRSGAAHQVCGVH